MKRAVVWSHVARAEYLEVIRYIAADDPAAAARVADQIEAAGAQLADFATGRAGRVRGTYEKVVSGLPYILAYESHHPPRRRRDGRHPACDPWSARLAARAMA